MSTGTYLSAPTLAAIMDDAFEDAGIKPDDVNTRHITAAKLAVQRILNSWQARAPKQWLIKDYPMPLAEGVNEYVLPPMAMDVFTADLAVAGNERRVYPKSRSEYNQIPNKTQLGYPTSYTVKRLSDEVRIYLWPTPNQTSMVLNLSLLCYADDATVLGQRPEISRYALDALTSELAARMALKFNEKKYDQLNGIARMATATMMLEDRDRGPMRDRRQW